MKGRLTIIFFGSFLIINCNWIGSGKHVSKDIYNCYKLITILPNLDNKGEIMNITDSLFVAKIEDHIVFLIPIYKVTVIQNNETMETIFSFFEYKTSEKEGIFYKSLSDSIGYDMKVDTFMSKYVFSSLDFYEVVKKSVLINSKSEVNNQISRTYYSKEVIDETYNDTTILTFTKDIRKIDFPFCKKLDSSFGLSLTKARLLFNEKFLPKHNIKLPKREIIFEIIKVEKEIPELNLFLKKIGLSN